MRDLQIDEDWDIPTEFDEKRKIEMFTEFLEQCDYDISDIDDDELDKMIMDGINDHLDYYTHLNGKIYVDNWRVFNQDLYLKLNGIIEKRLGI